MKNEDQNKMDDRTSEIINIIATELFDMGLGRSIYGIFQLDIQYGFMHKTKSVELKNEIRVDAGGKFPLASDFVGLSGQVMFETNMGPYFLELYNKIAEASGDKFSFVMISVSAEGKPNFKFIYDENDVAFDDKVVEWRKSLGNITSENKSVVSKLTKDEEIRNRHALNILSSNLSSKDDKLEAIRSLKLVMMVNDEGLIDNQYLITVSEQDDYAFFANCALTNDLFATVLQGSDDTVHPLVAGYEDLYEFGKTFTKDETLSFFIIDGIKGVVLPIDLINMAYLAS